jgi:dTDP-4-dehydrorhamnose 3,5-epimerase
MQVSQLAIEGVWSFTPVLRPDDRGVFLEAFKQDLFSETVGHALSLEQMNISVSKQGTVRGVHFAQVPPGQAKYVQCFSGRILDVVVDIRIDSPTFGQWDAIELDEQSRTGLYISEGLGHAFCALSDSATVGYLCSAPYAPGREHGIHPLDPALGLPWPAGTEALLSPKDASAPTLAQAAEQGLLPTFEQCQQFIRTHVDQQRRIDGLL